MDWENPTYDPLDEGYEESIYLNQGSASTVEMTPKQLKKAKKKMKKKIPFGFGGNHGTKNS